MLSDAQVERLITSVQDLIEAMDDSREDRSRFLRFAFGSGLSSGNARQLVQQRKLMAGLDYLMGMNKERGMSPEEEALAMEFLERARKLPVVLLGIYKED